MPDDGTKRRFVWYFYVTEIELDHAHTEPPLEGEKHNVIYAGLIIFKLLKHFIPGIIFKMTSQGESEVPVLFLK